MKFLKKGGEEYVDRQENEDQIRIEDLPSDDAHLDEVKGGSPGIGILRSTDGGSTWTI